MVVEFTAMPWSCTGALLGTAIKQCEIKTEMHA